MLGHKGRLTVAALAAASVLTFAPDAGAQSLYDNLVELAKTQKQVKAAEADLEAAKQRSESAWKKWYPELSVTGSYGVEKQNNTTGTADTEGVPREVDVKLTQSYGTSAPPTPASAARGWRPTGRAPT